MPQIIVTAGDVEGGSVMLRERVSVADFESGRFAVNLVERLGWAVSDATEAEHERTADTEDGRTADHVTDGSVDVREPAFV